MGQTTLGQEATRAVRHQPDEAFDDAVRFRSVRGARQVHHLFESRGSLQLRRDVRSEELPPHVRAELANSLDRVQLRL
eukprot:12054749-Heterocapsa_arctica.AAC.1